MTTSRSIRYFTIAAVLVLGVCWAFVSASAERSAPYPNGQFLISASALKQKLDREPVIVVDVRTDKYFDGKLIPGAVRMPWSQFRHDDPATNMGGLFVGVAEAQRILGEHGIFRNDTVVLYDSVARDGGATASYVFWVFDLLGHKKMSILEQGIDGWISAGGKVVNEPRTPEPLLYQAPKNEIALRRLADENFIYPRLGDPYYQILDVRSREEYLGEALNTTLNENPLKAGHIPGAYNINYELNWVDSKSKAMKSYADLAELYRGIDPDQALVTYCHSARRGSFSYFVLRLLGFDDVMLYDNSWYGWGNPQRFYPVETTENLPPGKALPKVTRAAGRASQPEMKASQQQKAAPESTGDNKGYISCGG